MYSGRLDYYGYPVFIRECEEVRLVNNKVDHPEKSMRRALEEKDDRGSKDVSDSVAAVCQGLMGQVIKRTKWKPLEGVDLDSPEQQDEEELRKRTLRQDEMISDGEDD
jgi:hypothetical protein